VGYYTSNGTGAVQVASTTSSIDNWRVLAHSAAPPTGPDLIPAIQSLGFTVNRPRTRPTIKGSIRILNAGNGTARVSRVRVLLSSDGTPSSDDVELKVLKAPVLRAGKSKTLKLNVPRAFDAQLPGKFVLVVVDPDDLIGETDEENNSAVAQLQGG
jgi:subtilase family serine protease